MEDLVIIFPPSINRVSVPINILPDDQVELLEDFRLALVSQADNPSTNIRIGPNINTQVRINDDEVLKVGFDPDNLEFNEDEGEVTICAVILSPDVAMNVMAIFNIFAEPGTATNPEDYRATTREEAEASINIPQFFLDNNNRQACTSITIVNDTVGEGPETLQLMFVFSTVFTQVEVEGCPVNITIMDRRYSKIRSTSAKKVLTTATQLLSVGICQMDLNVFAPLGLLATESLATISTSVNWTWTTAHPTTQGASTL
jgi:hypothetical protein